MSAPRPIAVFGAGQAYHRLYAPALALTPEFEVVAIADPAVPGDYPTPESVLESVSVQGVIVLSPPAVHADQVRTCTGQGLRVLVEKPPAVTVAEVDGWPGPDLVTPAFSRRYWQYYDRPVGAGHHFAFQLETNPDSWGARRPEGVERDLLPHAADLAIWLSGEAITAVEDVRRADGRVSGTFIMDGGGTFEWRVGHGPRYVETLLIDGRPLANPDQGRVREAFRRIRRRPAPAVAAIAALLSDWCASFDGGRPPTLPDAAAARSCAKVLEAVESQGSGPRE